MNKNKNKHKKTVDGFGDEWERFDQSSLSNEEHKELFDRYFSIFPWDSLPKHPIGFDMGCGSGRWAKLLADRVDTLHCFDPSSALKIAKNNLKDKENCIFHSKGVGDELLPDNTQDFGISLGVLHHVPNTADGIKNCVDMLKPGAPFLVYLYYALDNRPMWFRILWNISNYIRGVICIMPHPIRYLLSQLIAVFVYLPLARVAALLEKIGFSNYSIDSFPLSAYRHLSFYTMRTDALDRFGTRLEQRFTKVEIQLMLESAGLEKIKFFDGMPYWLAVGFKR